MEQIRDKQNSQTTDGITSIIEEGNVPESYSINIWCIKGG